MKILILGAAGMVARALTQFIEDKGVVLACWDRGQADITNYETLRKKILSFMPTHIFNCAAMTNVDQAEAHPEKAYAVNAYGPENLGRIALECKAHLIHLSTDYVFASEGDIPFKEEDVSCPINIYGKSKYEGERLLQAVMPSSCIVRTSWVYGGAGKNFISSLARLLQEREEVEVAFDQRGKPTFCRDLARALWEVKDLSGIYHFSGSDALSRYEIAKEIFTHMQNEGKALACKRITAVPASTFFTPARRPSYSVLDTSKFENKIQRKPRSFTDTLKELFDEVST